MKLPFPTWILYLLITLATLALLPIAWIARVRNIPSETPRLHLIQDMDNQGRYKAQQGNPIFKDGRAMRKPVAGTVARGELRADSALYRGLTDTGYVNQFPMAVTSEVMDRGQRQFDIFCSPCHGLSGYGDGMVNKRAEALQQGAWIPPASLHDAPYTERELGHYFNTITNGIRNMPAYGSQIDVEDRWAIVAYMKALQLSQNAPLEDIPAAQRSTIRAAN